MRRRPPRSTRVRSSAASDVYKRQVVGEGLFDDGKGLKNKRVELGHEQISPGFVEPVQITTGGNGQPSGEVAAFRLQPRSQEVTKDGERQLAVLPHALPLKRVLQVVGDAPGVLLLQ